MMMAFASAWRAAVAALLLGGLAAAATAGPVTDCPLRDAPFSVDSPLIDVLLSPAAVAVLQGAWPMARSLPAWMGGKDAPSFAAIMTLRALAGQDGFPPLDKLDAAL